MRLGAERQWQAHQGNVEIAGRRRRPAADHLGRPGQLFHQPRQGRIDFEHHFGAPVGQGRDIPAELQRVAEALFGVDQQGAPLETLAAQPQRHREITNRRLELAGAPAPFVLPPALGVLAQGQAAHGLMEMGFRIVGLQRQRPVEGGHGLVEAALLAEDDGAVQMGLGVIRIERDGLGEAQQRLVQPLELVEGAAALVVRLGVARFQRDGPFATLQSLSWPPKVAQGHHAVAPGIGVVRLQGDGAVIGFERLGRPLQVAQHVAACGVQFGVRRPQGQGRIVGVERFIAPAEVTQGPAGVTVGVGHGGLQRGRPPVRVDRLGRSSQGVEHHTAIEMGLGLVGA